MLLSLMLSDPEYIGIGLVAMLLDSTSTTRNSALALTLKFEKLTNSEPLPAAPVPTTYGRLFAKRCSRITLFGFSTTSLKIVWLSFVTS